MVATSTVVTAFVVGVVVSCSPLSCRRSRAATGPPIAALRDVAVDRSGASVARVVAGLAVTGAGVAAFATGLVGDGDRRPASCSGSARSPPSSAWSPWARSSPARPCGVLGRRLAGSRGVTGRWPARTPSASPKRTAATAAALMIGVALVGFITILAASTRASVEARVDRSLRADYVVESGVVGRTASAPSVEGDLAASRAVETMSPVRVANVEVDGGATQRGRSRHPTIDDLYDLEVAEGAVSDVRGDAVAVSSTTAEEQDLHHRRIGAVHGSPTGPPPT